METYCVSCKKFAENENSSVIKTKQKRLMLLLKEKINFYMKKKELHSFSWFKMNKVINTFLLTGDKFMPELHLK